MVITVSLILLVLAFICFLLEALGVAATRVNLNALGMCFFVASFLFR